MVNDNVIRICPKLHSHSWILVADILHAQFGLSSASVRLDQALDQIWGVNYMNKLNKIILLLCLLVPPMVYAYPLEDTEFLKAAYCFHMAKAPRLEVDLTEKEKQTGRNYFFSELNERGLHFPQKNEYNEIKLKFMQWVVPRFKNQTTSAAIVWYQVECLSK
ncbi:hypothetical protein [Halomonas halmophila]|uniref:hypothetical protein n=1 Tax=Halomonas halmophila TaxID=252 RepID=UPI001476D88B|nr:hypothetical protein [Halomonas halmophila]